MGHERSRGAPGLSKYVALAYFAEHDMMMPGIHGPDVLLAMQAVQLHVPVVVCSGYDTDPFTQDCPFARHLRKPYAPEPQRRSSRIMPTSPGRHPRHGPRPAQGPTSPPPRSSAIQLIPA